MPKYSVGGVEVEFPHPAYDCQLAYMQKVVDALEGKTNALLESPTGTGKTLCLLCATLGWLEAKKGQDKAKEAEAEGEVERANLFLMGLKESRTIVYASRTHSQLAKVVKELRSTSYRPKTCVLGSRQQMCIHPTVSKIQGNAQNQACRALVAKQACKAHNSVQEWLLANKQAATQLLDIEDLVRLGRSGGGCPFYISRELQADAELVILPYNYLVDPKIRKSMTNLDWSKCVLIFDEAHNLERVCTDAASFDLTSVRLSQCMAEVQGAIEHKLQQQSGPGAAMGEGDTEVESFRVTKTVLSNLERAIAAHDFPPNGDGVTFPGHYIFELLAKADITVENFEVFLDQLLAVTQALEERDEEAGKSRSTYNVPSLADAVKIVQRSLGKLSEQDPPMFEGYRVHISDGKKENSKFSRAPGGSSTFKRMPTLSYWCFLPGIAMRELANLGVGTIIVTSGTLAPLASFSHELQLPFRESIENPHVIDPSQVWLGIVKCGPSNVRLNSSYRTRDLAEYKSDLGNAIANFARVVPDGLLVFFPSFVVMNKCVEHWQLPSGGSSGSGTIWDHITRHKQPIIEPRESKLFAQAAEDFRAKLDDPAFRGAIFFGVCRGKASEGLDFSDRAGRAVIVTGIPFAMKTDPQVRIKKEVLDDECRKRRGEGRGLSTLSGDQWYRQQASRAVNQALGRVIRHRHDYGAIILLDERFGSPSAQNDLSKWLRPHARTFENFGGAAGALTKFFRGRRGQVQVAGAGERKAQAREGNAAAAGGFSPMDAPALQEEGGGGGAKVGRGGGGAGGRGAVDVSGLSELASKFTAGGQVVRDGVGRQLSDVLAATKRRKVAVDAKKAAALQRAKATAPPKNAPAMRVMQLAKALYSKENYKTFIVGLKGYKDKKVGVDEFARGLAAAGPADKAADLLRALEHFVRAADLQEYRRLLAL